MLEGIHVGFLVESFAKKRLEILQRLIRENGGVIDQDGGVIIADARKHQQIDGFGSLMTSDVYSADWISDSITRGSLQNIDEYRLQHSMKKPKIERPKDIAMPKGFLNTTFDCFRPTPLDHHNKGLVEALGRIARQRYLTGNARSELSYNRAMAVLKSYPKEIESVEEAEPLQGIGPKIIGYIGEYLSTGRIRASEECMTEDLRVVEAFVKIHGVGPKTAQSWVDLGIRSIEELQLAVQQGDVKLQEDQKIGIKYYDDFCLKMSRGEVEAILAIVREAAAKLFGEAVVVEMTGGYRRGKTENGDADILIHPEAGVSKLTKSQIMTGLLKELAPRYVKDILSLSKEAKTDSLDLCFMAWRTTPDEPMRRVDFIVADRRVYPFAMLGWTGSRQFERSLRLYAQKQRHIKLTDHGMTGSSCEGVRVDTEEQIFEFLGVPYLPPHLRNC